MLGGGTLSHALSKAGLRGLAGIRRRRSVPVPLHTPPGNHHAATPRRAFQLRVVSMGAGNDTTAFGGEGEAGAAAPPPPDSESDDADELPGASFEQRVAAAQARAKSQAAKEFVRVYNLQRASGMGLQVDPKASAAWVLA